MHEELLTPEDAAELMGTRPEAVRIMLRRRMIAGVKVGGRWRVSRSTVDDWNRERDRLRRIQGLPPREGPPTPPPGAPRRLSRLERLRFAAEGFVAYESLTPAMRRAIEARLRERGESNRQA